jgi:hypothetical protein
MSSLAETFVLVNSTPTGGELDHFSPIGVSWFQQKSTWKVYVYDPSGTGGQIVEANLALSYYTNPSLADPTHQGLLQGHGVTVPIINCSEPSNVSYPVFNLSTWKITYQPYFPYTEQYYKLSVVQGVPYVPGYNQSVSNNNSAAYSGNCTTWSVSTGILGDMASYLGDADFGISPWVSDVTGDTQPNGQPLTNGMKALGQNNYALTANSYQPFQGGSLVQSGYHGYPGDFMTYGNPLNPDVISTQYDGARDGYAVGHSGATSPLALAITISSATDSNCYDFNKPSDQISASITQPGTPSPTVFSEAQYPTVWSSPAGCSFQDSDFNFYDSYTLPLNNSQSEFNISFTLWHNADPSGDNKWSSQTYTDSVATGYSHSIDTTCSGTCNGVAASWQVEPMPRAPVIFVGSTGETTMLPGYGLHYTGEQQFYGFYLAVTGSNSGPNDPFQASSGGALNVIVLSRATYLQTNLSANLSANTLSQKLPVLASCIGNSQVTTRNPGGSQLGLAGTWSGTMSDSCANLLLQNLLPLNSTGNVTGTYYTLSTPQVQLLGLDVGASQVVPFLPISGFNSQLGGSPSGFDWSLTGLVGGFFVSAGNFFHQPALVWLGNGIQALPSLVAALGQYLIGAWNAFVNAVAAAVAAAISILNIIAQVIISLVEGFVSVVGQAWNVVISDLKQMFVVPIASIELNQGVMSPTDYSTVTAQSSSTSLSNSQASADLGRSANDILAASTATFILNGVVIAVAAALSAGTFAPFAKIAAIASKVSMKTIVTNLVSAGAAIVGTYLAYLAMTNPSQGWLSAGIPSGNQFLGIVSAVVGIVQDAPSMVSFVTGGFRCSPFCGSVYAFAGDILAVIFLVLEASLQLSNSERFGFVAMAAFFGAFAFYEGLSQAAKIPLAYMTEAVFPEPATTFSQVAAAVVFGASVSQGLCIAVGSDC